MALTPVRAASSFLGQDLYREKGFLFCVGGFVQEDIRSLMEQCILPGSAGGASMLAPSTSQPPEGQLGFKIRVKLMDI